MSRDVWLRQLRIAGKDATLVARVLDGSVPNDGL